MRFCRQMHHRHTRKQNVCPRGPVGVGEVAEGVVEREEDGDLDEDREQRREGVDVVLLRGGGRKM